MFGDGTKPAAAKSQQVSSAGICCSGLKHNSQNAYAVTGVKSQSVSKYLPIHKLAWHEDRDVQFSAASSEASLCARTPAAWLVMSL